MPSPLPLSILFIPGAWHTPEIWNKVIHQLKKKQEDTTTTTINTNNNIDNDKNIKRHKYIPITLPSTKSTLDPQKITLLDDITAVRSSITTELAAGRNVVLVVHSYGGFVGACAVRGLTPALSSSSSSSSSSPPTSSSDLAEKKERDDAAASADGENAAPAPHTPAVIAIAMIATGFARLHTPFLAPFNNVPPPSWRLNNETGYAELVADAGELFYHDLERAVVDDLDSEKKGKDDDDNTTTQQYWTSRLTPQALSVFTTGAQHVYPGWMDVPVLGYLATTQDRALPVEVQRVFVADAEAERVAAAAAAAATTRDGHGGKVVHPVVVREVASSHSPMLSRVEETVEFILETVRAGVAAVEEKGEKREKRQM